MVQSVIDVNGPSFMRIYLQPNYVEIEGQLVQVGFPSYEGKFYDVLALDGNRGFPSTKNPNLLVQMDYIIAQNIN